MNSEEGLYRIESDLYIRPIKAHTVLIPEDPR